MSHQIGDLEPARERIAELEARLRVLEDHLAAAQYGCPNCGVHHGCIEMVAENARLKAQLSDASHRAVTATEEARVAKGIVGALIRHGAADFVEGQGFVTRHGCLAPDDAERALIDSLTTTKEPT